MIGRITYIISTAGFRAMDGVISDERRRLDNAIAPAAYVSYNPRMMSVVGWHGYRIAFKGGTRNMILYALELLRKNYAVSERYDNYEDGNYVVGVLLRDRARAYAFRTGTPEPEPDKTWLYFTMPEGGTVSLTTNGNPTSITLEYSFDNGGTWTEWTESEGVRTLTLNAGQTMHVRNQSETNTGFSTGPSSYYQFSFNAPCYSGGNVMSLNCAIPTIATMNNNCFRNLFKDCASLITAADFSGITIISNSGCQYMYQDCTSLTAAADMSNITSIGTNAFRGMYQGCTSLTTAADFSKITIINDNGCLSMYQDCTSLTAAADMSNITSINNAGCQSMYRGCTSLKTVRLGNPDISANICLSNWLLNVSATGDFYCRAELTIPIGASGIPSGWTRHNI